MLGNEIEEGDLYYVSKPQMKKTKLGGSDDGGNYIVDDVDLKKYYLMGFFGSQYVAMPEEPSDISAGCKPDKIARILMEFKSDNKKQMFAGEEWKLADGWSLAVRQVDVGGNKLWIQLNSNGEEMDTDFVVFKYAYLRGALTSLESGDNYDVFDVEGFSVPAVMNGTDYAGSGSGTILNTGDDALVMASEGDVILGPDKIIDLYGDMYLKTEETSGSCLKMTLWKTCKITVDDADVGEEIVKEEEEEVVVVDLAEEDYSGSAASTVYEAEETSVPISEDSTVVKSSVPAPGFGLVLCILGFLGAFVAKIY